MNLSPLQMENANNVSETLSGEGKCPNDPSFNSTAIMTSNGTYFVGTPLPMSNSIISRDSRYRGTYPYLRTKGYDANWLNGAQFVGSFETDSYVYFMFREVAMEYNCGKV